MNRRALFLIGIVILYSSLFSCTEPFHLPEGDPKAGRQAFLDMGCHACHRVQGEGFPDPVADPPVTIVLGQNWESKSRLEIAQSVLVPSHRIARYRRHVREGEFSRMGSFETMTLKEWIDIVSYLDSVARKPASP